MRGGVKERLIISDNIPKLERVRSHNNRLGNTSLNCAHMNSSVWIFGNIKQTDLILWILCFSRSFSALMIILKISNLSGSIYSRKALLTVLQISFRFSQVQNSCNEIGKKTRQLTGRCWAVVGGSGDPNRLSLATATGIWWMRVHQQKEKAEREGEKPLKCSRNFYSKS